MRPDAVRAIAVLLIALGVYVLSSPGRLDTIDAQTRFEVARNWWIAGTPEVRDPAVTSSTFTGPDGRRFAAYNAPASLLASPLLAVTRALGGRSEDALQFGFSLLSPLFGALLAALGWSFLRALGVEPRRATLWTLAAAFGSLLWPLAASSFDQVQHAFFVLLGLFLAWRSARADSAALALAGGLAAGVAIAYQENYALLAPVLAVAALDRERPLARRSALRYAAFGLGACVGLAAWAGYNWWRVGALVVPNRFGFGTLHPPLWGNPLVGALSLLASPGKGIFFFSPVLVLALAGWRPLARREPRLAQAALGAALAHFVFISWFGNFGGEQCWGPRYLVIVIALLHLGLPFATGVRKPLVVTIVAAGIAVQLLALSLDSTRFHYEHHRAKYFWHDDPWIYFRESQLAARPLEILATLRDGVPPTATSFRPGPYPERLTAAVGAAGPSARSELWMPYFQVFYLPRPWPLWLAVQPPEVRFVPLATLAALFGASVLGGAALFLAADAAQRSSSARVRNGT
ncbi:MAG TPA: hypothetical protein VLA66_01250 [Thermoanaerobaculia bacterium]|nr:hypothetical protein [Thermoanaerobaculia bacterium]